MTHTPSVMADSAATAAKNSTVVTVSVRLALVTLSVTACAAPATARSPAPTTRSLPDTICCTTTRVVWSHGAGGRT